MIQKGRTNNKQYFIRLSIIFILLAIVTPPVLAEGGTGFNFKPTLTSSESLIKITIYHEVVRDTNSGTTIKMKQVDRSISKDCCTLDEPDSNYIACTYTLEESLLDPIFMFACSNKNTRYLGVILFSYISVGSEV